MREVVDVTSAENMIPVFRSNMLSDARWQGYVILLGLGTTLTRNHNVAIEARNLE